MRKLKTKILNFLLASALGTAALGGALLAGDSVTADALAKPSGVFSSSAEATVQADETDKTKTAFVFPNGGKVSFRRDLALKWYEAKNTPKYLSFGFKFKDISFETLTFTLESATARKSDKDKATNTIAFTSDGTNVTVKVNDGAESPVDHTADLTVSLSEEDGAADGVYAVLLSGSKIGDFTNVGGYFADYKSSSLTPLQIEAKMPEDALSAKTTLYFNELNGQSFALNETTGEIAADTAAPVLVINEELSGFTLGAKFDVDYVKLDVLDDSLQATLEYYQYNPTHAEATWSKLSSDVYFSDTVYSFAEGAATTVYEEEGKEMIAVRLELKDDDHTATYEFSWYAESVVSPVNTRTATNAAVADMDYIPASINKVGPTLSASFDSADYQSKVEDEASEKSAGESAEFNLPSVEYMFADDDTKYKSFTYVIYYKSKALPDGTSTSSYKYNQLRIPVESEGEYEFKIVATDKSGNAMTADDGGEQVNVTADNVWDLDSLPSFTFKIKSSELSVEEGSKSFKNQSGIIGVEFEAKDFDVKGPSGYGSDYALYYFDMSLFMKKYENSSLDESTLASVNFADMVAPAFNPAEVEDVAELYAELYAKLLAEQVTGVTAEGLIEVDEDGNAILRKIGEYNSAVSENAYPDNKYEWNASEKSFVPAEEGTYIVFGIFTHPEQASNTVGAYQVIYAGATEDVIAGETQWLKNNLVSIVLFAIAAVLLVIIIILLLIKPSDETLEDIDKTKKKEKESDK